MAVDARAVFRAKAPRIMAQLMKEFGLTVEEAAAILGNLGHESRGLTAFQEVNPTVAGSAGGWGWGQWTGMGKSGRRRLFFDWIAAHGITDPKSDEANYGFLVHELKTSEAGAIAAVKRAVGLRAKVEAFEQKFERAGVKHYDSREQWAKIALTAYGASPVTGPAIPVSLPTPATTPTTTQDKKELGWFAGATAFFGGAWQTIWGSGAIRLILISVVAFALYWFVARPILRRMSALQGFYTHADELRMGLLDKVRLALKGVKTLLWGRFLALSGPLLAILQYADIIDLSDVLPVVKGISPALYVPLVLTPLLGLINNALRKVSTTPAGQTDLALATPEVVSPPTAPAAPTEDVGKHEQRAKRVVKHVKAKRKKERVQ